MRKKFAIVSNNGYNELNLHQSQKLLHLRECQNPKCLQVKENKRLSAGCDVVFGIVVIMLLNNHDTYNVVGFYICNVRVGRMK